ncbi:membrane c-type cytochrome cy [hydrothermal vent metagenome]|uniref:Membrane c-type cytochrome cy n=1 Tax=hydrothermal vent metagenome TaxID=652676 RepID=A0A1W1EDV1_9ZZZZ
MFKSYHKLFLSTALVAATATSVVFAGNTGVSPTYANGKKVIDGGVTYPVKNNKTSLYHVNTKSSKGGFTFGKQATANEIKAWDIDVMPDGTGLPEGSGTVEEGDEIYETKCASCHFDFGTGGAGYPALQKGNAYEGQKSLTNQRVDGNDEGPLRVFGTYWPHASTLWWYIKTGMPHPAPMTLTNDEVYALSAYILSINEMTINGEELDDEYELNREKFLKIVMPNKDGFIPKIDGPKGLDNVREFFADTKNYGNGTRCMKNCFEGKPVLARIAGEGISDYEPPISTKRAMPAEKEGDAGAEMPGKKAYEASCSVCHATDAMGAPPVGDKKAWAAVVKKGIDKVNENAINGINGMPPKGGTSLDDAKLKEIVNYMINASK